MPDTQKVTNELNGLRNKRNVSSLSKHLLQERAHKILQLAMNSAEQGDCLFWIDPDRNFVAIQQESNKILLAFETGESFMTSILPQRTPNICWLGA